MAFFFFPWLLLRFSLCLCFWAIWLLCILVYVHCLMFLCLGFVSFWISGFHQIWNNFGHCFFFTSLPSFVFGHSLYMCSRSPEVVSQFTDASFLLLPFGLYFGLFLLPYLMLIYLFFSVDSAINPIQCIFYLGYCVFHL